MSKKVYLFSLVLLALAFTACSETEEVSRYDNWRARSEAYIDEIAAQYNSAENKALPDTDPEKLYAIEDESTKQLIYLKKVEKGTGTVSPVFTSKIKADYRMSYFNGDVVQQTFSGTKPTNLDPPAEFNLSNVISGWSYALAHMVVGDFWTLYIPYQSGYGSGTGPDGSLQPYSALIYNVKLAEIIDR